MSVAVVEVVSCAVYLYRVRMYVRVVHVHCWTASSTCAKMVN